MVDGLRLDRLAHPPQTDALAEAAHRRSALAAAAGQPSRRLDRGAAGLARARRGTSSRAPPRPYDAGPPGSVTSPIDVDVVDGAVETIDVGIDVEHTWHGDLTISLLSPSAQRVDPVSTAAAARGDHFRNTTFASDARRRRSATRIAALRRRLPPRGRPGRASAAARRWRWKLEISDRAFQDGGALRSWGLAIAPRSSRTRGFDIEVRFLGGLTAPSSDAFQSRPRAGRS